MSLAERQSIEPPLRYALNTTSKPNHF